MDDLFVFCLLIFIGLVFFSRQNPSMSALVKRRYPSRSSLYSVTRNLRRTVVVRDRSHCWHIIFLPFISVCVRERRKSFERSIDLIQFDIAGSC